jgi:hypothetical protein
MSTRSVVAVPNGDAWRGRYVHSDGYPSGIGRVLTELVRRDGVQAVREMVVTGPHYGWSFLENKMPDIKGVTPDPDGAWASAGAMAHHFGPDGIWGDGRFRAVPGYGAAYTDTVITSMGRAGYQQVTEDQWLDPDDCATNVFIEWAYVLGDRALFIYEDGHTPVGAYDYQADTDWEAVEASTLLEQSA